MESILESVKKLLGIDVNYEHFDTDIIIHINSVLATLWQIGIGPANGFSIVGHAETWNDFMGDDPRLALVKTYIYMKVKLAFDPPQSGGAVESLNNQIKELEWRIEYAGRGNMSE